MYDPDLHLFINDDEISFRQDMYRMVQKPRREAVGPLFTPSGQEEGTAIGYSTVYRDPQTGQYRLWYSVHEDGLVRLAVSQDGLTWQRRGLAMPREFHIRSDNQQVAPVGKRVAPFFQGAKLVGFCYFYGELPSDRKEGLHLVRSMDGEHLEALDSPILPGVGDRSSLTYDAVNDEYILISRSCGSIIGLKPEELGKPRTGHLWKSHNLVDWTNCNVGLCYDEHDPADVQIYGMQPFRCGPRWLALVEIYYAGMERLNTQLAWSTDGLRWRRVADRETFLDWGGEGAWDSHWVVSTHNEPILDGDRYRIYYSGTSTKHGSGKRHRRGIGLATIRKDGWVSLEAGRVEGKLITTPLPLNKPMVLELNANCFSGYITCEIVRVLPDGKWEAVPGYDGEAGRIEQVDGTRIRVRWKDRDVVQPVEGSQCYIRFTSKQSSLFSYRWSPAGR